MTTDTTQVAAPDTIGYRINLLARLMAQALKTHTVAEGVLPGQYPLLAALWGEDGLTQKQLVERVRIEQSTIAHTLKRMERDGLIDRLPCPTDGRLVRHWLTPRGRAVQSIVLTGIASVNERAVHNLSEAAVAQVVDMLDVMIANLDPAAGHAGKAQSNTPEELTTP
ncbi:DNA-binding MarR family transcriptional regulator [Amorphus suaedae]